MVIRDSADLSSMASFVRDMASFLHMPGSIAEQALVDVYTVVCNMPISFAPVAMLIVFVWAMFPPVHKVIEPCIEHGSRDVQDCWGIVEDMWFQPAKGICMGKSMQGVLLLLSHVII
jgi:hypothetical protein